MRFLTDEQILAEFIRDNSRDNERKRYSENYENYVSLERQESSKRFVWLFAKVGAQQSDNDSINPPEMFHKNIFRADSFD